MQRLLLILALCIASNINCGDSSCTYCLSGYLYQSASCLPLCPTGYTQNSSPNTCSAAASQNIFYLNFYGFRHFSATSIDNFEHPSGLQFQDALRQSPIPTVDRGFYFASTSRLVSTVNYILGPDLTLSFCIYIITDGTIFEATSGGISYFKISVVSGTIVAYWYLTSVSSSSIKSLNGYSNSGYWMCISVYSSQSSGQFSMTSGVATSTISGFEFRGQVSDMVMYFGGQTSGGSFAGFFDNVAAYNSAITTYSSYAPFLECNYNEYITYSGNYYYCNPCSGCSNSWPWCIDSSCEVCYASSCTACGGFGYEDCTACNNGKTAPDCEIGFGCNAGTGFFVCTTCNSYYTLIDGLCLTEPYNYNSAALSTPVVNTNFDTFEKYYAGIFQSGSNANTWGPFNSPDSDDPIPVKSRGLYFDGVGTYLTSYTNFALNYKFSVSHWIYRKNTGYTVNVDYFAIESDAACNIVVQNSLGYIYNYGRDSEPMVGKWIFQAYSVNFVSNSVTLTYTNGFTVRSLFSIDGYAYYDSGGHMAIGTNYSSYFKGFIYSIAIWQTYITDFSTEYNTCGTSSGDLCLWESDLGYYYNQYTDTYVSCETSCTSGCATWGTCAQCEYPDCATCTNFNSTCTSTVAAPCLAGFALTTTKKCCNPACGDCYGRELYNCLACNSGSYLLVQVCMSSCPLGYIASGADCVENHNPFLILTMNLIEDEVIDSTQGIVFETGLDNKFYPSGKSSDPIPAKERGYYFTGISYMTSQSIVLPCNFTMIFYIKQTSGGVLLSKNAFTINTLTTVVFSISSVITATFNGIPSTSWNIMSFSLWTETDGTTTVSITYPQSSYTNSQSTTDVIYIDSSSALTLGDSSSSFVGFLYQFQLYIYPYDVSGLSTTICTTSSEANCLWDCDILYFLSGASCTSCSNSCTGGCVRGSDCNLCDDCCVSCLSFDSASCSTCIVDASLTAGECTCDAGYYWDGVSSCSSCYGMCSTCTGPNLADCTSCISNAATVSGLCTCNNGWYWDAISACVACSAICTECTGASYCTNCISNASLNTGVCTCNVGWYWDGISLCAACNSICVACTGPNLVDCTSCVAHASIVNAMCTCDARWYWNGVSACNLCDSACAVCTGSNQCNTCVTHASMDNEVCACDVGWYWDGISSCSPCDTACMMCTGPTLADCFCMENSIQVGGSCICNDGYYLSGFSCEICDNTCLTCIGPTFYECTSCLYGLLEIVCLTTCPIGFVHSNSQCILEVKWDPIVEFVFNTLEGVFYDKFNHIGALTGESASYYPSLDPTDPIPAYQRGIYFTGEGSYLTIPYPPESQILFGIRFFLSTWVNPFSTDGTLFYKPQEANIIFSASLGSLQLSTIVIIDKTEFHLTAGSALVGYMWNNILISVDYSGAPSIAITINRMLTPTTLATAAPFMDSIGTTMFVGTDSPRSNCFQGFMYSISIYAWSPSIDSLAKNTCENCFVCPVSGICIPTCNITTYSSIIPDCTECNSTCITGCRNNQTCNLCDDPNCVGCTSYDKDSCETCIENFEIQNGSCVGCTASQYFDSSLKLCKDCRALCLTCLSQTYCTSCADNSKLDSNNLCVCDEGYSGTILCSRKKFTAFISIDNQNQAIITFTEPLLINLTANSMIVVVQNSAQDFLLSNIDNSTYVVSINFTQDVYSGDTINITFTSQIVSSLNNVLGITSLVGTLFAGSYSDVVSEINKLHSYALIGLTVGISTVLGTSALNLDPTSFFSFLNSVEIYSYIALYQIELDPGLSSFLSELNVMAQLPNPLAYAISMDKGVQLSGRMNGFGNNTNLLLLNSGLTLMVFIACILGKIGINLLQLIPHVWIKMIGKKYEMYFKYGIFSRLWIQSCLEIFMNSLVGIIYTKFANAIQIIDFIMCCTMLV